MGVYRSSKPYWITVKYPSKCSRCNQEILRGQDAFYYPRERQVLCGAEACGKQEARDLAAADFDEANNRSL